MSAYARAAHALGATVSGSDAQITPYSKALQADGILDAKIGYRELNLPQVEGLEVFYSSAVPASNPERQAARERGIGERPRAHLLGQLSSLRSTIAVAGTHGKTTTSWMVVHALRAAGLDPGWLIGSSIANGLANAHWSSGEWLVIEADESDRSMLSLDVQIAVLTNVELDHHATFGSLSQLRECFREFLAGAQLAVIWDRPELLALRSAPQDTRTVAYDVPRPTLGEGRSSFAWHGYEVRLAVPGAHNALNGAAALEAAALAGADAQLAISGLAGFHGADRRFQKLGEGPGGALIYDDYAHHPTEVAATLQAARTLEHERLVAVFQPHLYSRTELLADDFGKALTLADAVVVLDVYPARERAEDHPGISGRLIVDAANGAGASEVHWSATLEEAESLLRGMLREGDLVVVMGAGNVNLLGDRLLDR